MEAGAQVKMHGLENDLVDRIRRLEYFLPICNELDELLNPETFVGRATPQVRVDMKIHFNIFLTSGRSIFEE